MNDQLRRFLATLARVVAADGTGAYRSCQPHPSGSQPFGLSPLNQVRWPVAHPW